MASSMNTRSSVTMLPVAPGANGQPPSPASELSKVVTPDVEPRDHVGQPLAARVVQVQAGEVLVAGDGAHRDHEFLHLARIGIAHRIRQADFVARRRPSAAR